MAGMIKNKGVEAGIVLEDDENGYPSSRHLTMVLFELITNKEKYNKLKFNTKEVFNQFSIKNCVNQYLELFKV